MPTEQAIEQLRALGPMAVGPVRHRGVRDLEVSLSTDPLSPRLALTVEQRPSGSYITAYSVPSAFLQDFVLVVQRALLFFAAIGLWAGAAWATSADGRSAALSGVLIGWASLHGLVSVLHAVLLETQAPCNTAAARVRLRHRLACAMRPVRPL